MEKLQAALARAREKREGGTDRPLRTTDVTARNRARRAAKDGAIGERWAAIPMFEPSSKRMHDSRIYSSEASVEAQHFDILRTKLFLEMRRNDWPVTLSIGAVTATAPRCPADALMRLADAGSVSPNRSRRLQLLR